MKIKRFNENNNIQYYWEVETEEPYFEISLDFLKEKYGCDITVKDLKDASDLEDFNIDDYIYISRYDEDTWNYTNDVEYLKEFNYTFIDELNFTDEEIDIIQQTKKYNLWN